MYFEAEMIPISLGTHRSSNSSKKEKKKNHHNLNKFPEIVPLLIANLFQIFWLGDTESEEQLCWP